MPLFGGVSRPSMKQWTNTRSTLFSRAMRSSAKRCSMCECTPPSLTRPIRCSCAFAAALHRFEQQRLAEELAARDQLVDARDVHLHDAARAHIQVAHFAIAHLPFGQADEWAGGVNQRVGKIRQQAVVIRLARESDGVALGFGAVAPAVEHGEHDRFRSFGHVSDRRLAREQMNARGARRASKFSAITCRRVSAMLTDRRVACV